MKFQFRLMVLLAFLGMTGQLASAESSPVALPMSEAVFNDVLAHMNQVLKPLVAERYKAGFIATGDWPKKRTPTSPGGSAYRPFMADYDYHHRWGVHIAGWLARLPEFTSDSMMFVLCHELGHHVFGNDAEPQADHFVPTCLSWLWSESDNVTWLRHQNRDLSPIEKELCQDLPEVSDQAFCRRIALAFSPIEDLRVKTWKEYYPSMTQEQILRERDCRRQAVLAGIQQKPGPSCRFDD